MRRTAGVGIGLLVALATAGVGAIRAQTGSTAAAYPPVEIVGTQLRKITSRAVGQDYLVKVRLPENYGEPGKLYPVLYLLDGDHAFAMATDIVEYLSYGSLVPDLIVVSPAYGSKHGPSSGGTNMRDLDFGVPGPTGLQNARGDRYLRFLKEELVPYVEREFRADPTNRALWGYSAGARFALYAMLQEPELFQRYVIVDGFASYLPQMEQEYAARRRDLPVRAFLASAIPQADLYRFAERLKSRGYRGLSLDYADLAGINHYAVGGEGLARGLKSVYNQRSVYEELLPMAARSDARTVLARYDELRATRMAEYAWGEGDLDQLGTALYRMDRPRDAIEVLKRNTVLYPESGSVHQTLADVARLTGDRALAIEHYRRTLQLNPKNQRAADMLARLEKQP